jgi:hypothetical protein
MNTRFKHQFIRVKYQMMRRDPRSPQQCGDAVLGCDVSQDQLRTKSVIVVGGGIGRMTSGVGAARAGTTATI